MISDEASWFAKTLGAVSARFIALWLRGARRRTQCILEVEFAEK
jgi:hypothetical protein